MRRFPQACWPGVLAGYLAGKYVGKMPAPGVRRVVVFAEDRGCLYGPAV